MSMSKDEQRPLQEEVNEPAHNQEQKHEQKQQQQQQNQEPASQSVVEVVPVFPTQEVIDISSGSDDDNEPQPQPIKLLVPKIEDCLVSSPSSKLITEVQPDPSVPSFSLNLGFPTPPVTQDQPPTTLDEEFPLTTRTMAVINNMNEPVSGPEPTTATPQPT
ncbi:hypothetical protein PIB30_012896 [Stylosanthes scabra]|uniref:Uncharacterized protein n=1 Tax=Stylosanthes scabra TaxID=79078 RepID=A0ABU6X4I3_9FABA|nr:hypothetical protein [Stylosanthes scabra]